MQERFNKFILSIYKSKDESEFFKKIKNFLEINGIDSEICFNLDGKEVIIRPFKEILIKKSEKGEIFTKIKGELGKDYEDIFTSCLLFIKNKKDEEIIKRIKEVPAEELIYFIKEKVFKLENFPFFRPFMEITEKLEKIEEERDGYKLLSEIFGFSFFKITSAEREEFVKEVLIFSLRRIIKDYREFLFLFLEEKEGAPLETLFSSPFIDQFFYEDLWRNRIRKREKKISYKGKILNLFYSNLIYEETGVLGVLTDNEIKENEILNFLDYLCTLTLYFYLKKRIKFSYTFTKKTLPLINLKAFLLRKKKDDEILSSLINPMQKIELSSFLNNIISSLETDILRKKINLKIKKEKEEIFAEGDAVLLKIAFKNLFKYLISFNRIRGFMNIDIYENKIIIEDSGIGLTDAEKSSLLDPSNLDEPLSLTGGIFKIHGFELNISVERGIGNKISILF